MVTLTLRTCLFVAFLLLLNQLHAKTNINGQYWEFDVYLDDQRIGFHKFELKTIDGQQRLYSEAQFEFKFLFMNVYDYHHKNTEIWHNQCLQRLNAHTDDNGDYYYVKLNYFDQKTIIETAEGKHTVNQCIRSFAYWAPELLTIGPMLNSQTGELIDITLSYKGAERITINNTVIDSDHYQIKGKDLNIGLWYSKNRQWLALTSALKNGQFIHYRLQEHLIL